MVPPVALARALRARRWSATTARKVSRSRPAAAPRPTAPQRPPRAVASGLGLPGGLEAGADLLRPREGLGRLAARDGEGGGQLAHPRTGADGGEDGEHGALVRRLDGDVEVARAEGHVVGDEL